MAKIPKKLFRDHTAIAENGKCAISNMNERLAGLQKSQLQIHPSNWRKWILRTMWILRLSFTFRPLFAFLGNLAYVGEEERRTNFGNCTRKCASELVGSVLGAGDHGGGRIFQIYRVSSPGILYISRYNATSGNSGSSSKFRGDGT